LIPALIEVAAGPKFFGKPAPSEERKQELLNLQVQTLTKLGDWLEGKLYVGGQKLSLADF